MYHVLQYLAQGETLLFKKQDLGGLTYLQVLRCLELDSIMEKFHSSRLDGHFAVNRTLSRIQEVYHWIGMVRDVTNFIKSCKVS